MPSNKPYPKNVLYRYGPQATRRGRQLDEISFPLGGIGTGCIALGGWGHLREWEIMNRPARNFGFNDSFFTLQVNTPPHGTVTKILQGPSGGTLTSYGNPDNKPAAGYPHFRDVAFTGSYPFARVALKDPKVPLRVELEAFNPFIPLNDKDSSIPVAILIYHLKNPTAHSISGRLFGNLRNRCGHPDTEGRVNTVRRAAGLTGLYLDTTLFPKDSRRYGNMALATPTPHAKIWPRWHEDKTGKFWEAITESRRFPPPLEGAAPIGTVAVDFTIPANGQAHIPFFITWYFPKYLHSYNYPLRRDKTVYETDLTNWYAATWQDSWDVAQYVHANYQRLYDQTRRFHDDFFASTLPDYVLEAISSQMCTLKTPTCVRLEDGTLYGYEGCDCEEGCCHGSCTHVWNYAQTPAYLFPKLQQSMRAADYRYAMRANGQIAFRLPLPLGRAIDWEHSWPCGDGQMGGVLQVYREWRLSGDDAWLRKMWPLTQKALEFAWVFWDPDKDGVMEGVQHNTWDIEFWGPNTMVGSLYLGALKAAAVMARHLGATAKAAEYEGLFRRGSAWTDAHLFNGNYYEQKVNPKASALLPPALKQLAEHYGRDGKYPWPKWQFGKGCLTDQLIGQWYAHMLELGHIYKSRHVRRTLRSLFDKNWMPDLTDTITGYALNEEAGMLCATWPRGDKPGHPFYFGDRIFSGCEYQVAAHMIYEGLIDEGLTVVKAIRNRYTGERRNPWDEYECGRYYARTMSNYSLLTALSGFAYSAPEKRIGFAPKIRADDFTSFFCVGSGWGLYRQQNTSRRKELSIRISHGSLTLRELRCVTGRSPTRCRLGGRLVRFRVQSRGRQTAMLFDAEITVAPDKHLTVTL